jgi:hypothetical protein
MALSVASISVVHVLHRGLKSLDLAQGSQGRSIGPLGSSTMSFFSLSWLFEISKTLPRSFHVGSVIFADSVADSGSLPVNSDD